MFSKNTEVKVEFKTREFEVIHSHNLFKLFYNIKNKLGIIKVPIQYGTQITMTRRFVYEDIDGTTKIEYRTVEIFVDSTDINLIKAVIKILETDDNTFLIQSKEYKAIISN